MHARPIAAGSSSNSRSISVSIALQQGKNDAGLAAGSETGNVALVQLETCHRMA